MLTLDSVCEFVWGFGHLFLLEHTEDGVTCYYVWSDPDYDGDNTIKPFKGDRRDRLNFAGPGFGGRYKGVHRIRDYCGDQVRILDQNTTEKSE